MLIHSRYFLLPLLLAGCFWTSSVRAAGNSEHSTEKIIEAVTKSGFNLSMITEDNFKSWLNFVEPTIEELDWNSVRWHNSLSAAAKEAKRINQPILLWTMNGHPFSDT